MSLPQASPEFAFLLGAFSSSVQSVPNGAVNISEVHERFLFVEKQHYFSSPV